MIEESNLLYKESLHIGDMVVYHDTGFLPVAIQKIVGTPYNHCEIISSLIADNTQKAINGAVAKGVKQFDIKEHMTGEYVSIIRPRSNYDWTTEQIKAFSDHANSQVDKAKYDFASLLIYKLAYEITGKWYGKCGTTKPESTPDRFYCYEYVDWCYDRPDWWNSDLENYINNPDFDYIFRGKIINVI